MREGQSWEKGGWEGREWNGGRRGEERDRPAKVNDFRSYNQNWRRCFLVKEFKRKPFKIIPNFISSSLERALIFFRRGCPSGYLPFLLDETNLEYFYFIFCRSLVLLECNSFCVGFFFFLFLFLIQKTFFMHLLEHWPRGRCR